MKLIHRGTSGPPRAKGGKWNTEQNVILSDADVPHIYGRGGGSNIVVHVLRIKQTNRRTLIADDPLGWAEKSSDIALSAHWPPI